MDKVIQRRRPRINTTISIETLDILRQVETEQQLRGTGTVIDYITEDWVGLKQAAIKNAMPLIEAVPA